MSIEYRVLKMRLNLKKLSKMFSIYLGILIFLNYLQPANTSIDVEVLQSRETLKRKRQYKNIEEPQLPMKNISTNDIKLYLKHSPISVFIKDLGPKSKINPELCSENKIRSMLVDIRKIYTDNPIVTISHSPLKKIMLREINGFSCANQMTSAPKVLLNYQAMRWYNINASLYKYINTFLNDYECNLYYCKLIFDLVSIRLYNNEIKEFNKNFKLAKESFVKQLKSINMSMKDLDKIQLGNSFTKAITDEKPYENILNTTRLSKIVILGYCNILFSYIELVYLYSSSIDDYLSFYASFFKVTNSIDSILNNESVNFSLLRDIYVVYSVYLKIEKDRTLPKEYNEKWETPVFIRAIKSPIDNSKLLLAIEFKTEEEEKTTLQIVDFTDENIKSIQNAQSIEEIKIIQKTKEDINPKKSKWTISAQIYNEIKMLKSKIESA